MKETKDLCEFEGFRFDLATNTLWREGEVVPLSPKSLELLKLLVSRNGEVVSKQEIFDTVWAGTFVEDGVLTQNVYTLRQMLGKDLVGKQTIENLARRGYRFSAPVKWIAAADAPTISSESTQPQSISTAIRENRVKRSPTTVGLVVVGLVAIILLISIGGYLALSSNRGEGTSSTATAIKFTRLTDKGDVSYLAISPDGAKVAYTHGFEVYVRDLATDNETKVNIEAAGKVGCIQFAHDGLSLYFGTVFNRDEKGNIFQVGLGGGKPVLVAANVWTGFSISPDGTELAFVRKIPEQNSQVLIRRRLDDGSEKMEAGTELPEEFYWNNYPAWSADGSKIALVAVNQTEHLSRIVIFENGRRSDFIPPNFRNIEQVVWTTNGNGLIASGNEGETFQIWRFSLTGGSAKRITNDLNSYLGIAVSHDRKQIVARQRIYYSNIWMGHKDDLSNLTQVTDGTGRNDGLNGLAWVDEERIVYTTNDQRIRDWNLWVVNTIDGSKRKLTNDTDVQNDLPAVGGDRKTVYFASDRNRQRRIWKIDVEGGIPEQVTFGEDETHQFPQVSPDGKLLYFIIKGGRTSNIGRATLTERSVQELAGKTSFIPGNLLSLSPDGRFLVFQNIAAAGEDASGHPALEVAVISTSDPNDLKVYKVNTLRPWLQWAADGSGFDYVGGDVKETALFRMAIGSTQAESKPISPMRRSTIFNFAWSPSGERIAISQGQLLRDVILLRDIE